jgi:23S rRNA pseudouridine1911/1915/1917 synthase
VPEGAASERLDVYLAAALSLPRNRVQKLLQAAAVTVNGEPERPSYQVQPGDRLEVNEETPTVTPAPAPQLNIIYEDDDLLVVNKPAGLAMHPGSGLEGEPTVADFARHHTTDPDPERPGIVHRLDLDTSGLVILAKTSESKAYLQQQFASRAVHKTYTTLVVGRPSPAEAVIRLPLDRDPARPLRRSVIPGGREAVTRYRTLQTYPGYALLEANPETGRTHQIRVHLASIGHPVAGDTLYGPPRRPLGLNRQFLHASALEFTAPSGQHLQLESPLPPDLVNIRRELEKQV